MKVFNDYTVTPAHLKGAELSQVFQIDKGIITEAAIYFPPGCHSMIHAKIFFQEHQILPRNQEGWCHGNAGWWQGKLFFPVEAAPLNIKVIAYALNTSFPHTITAAIELSPFSIHPKWQELLKLAKEISVLLGGGD